MTTSSEVAPSTAPAAQDLDDRPTRARLARLSGLQRRFPMLQVGALLLLYVWGATSIDGFSSRLNIYSMLTLASFLGLAAAGQTLVVLIGGFDLSISAVIVLGGTIIVQLAGGAAHWPFIAALALALLCAALVGAVNGFICHFFRVQSLIVTLATAAVVTGVIQVWTHGLLTGAAPTWLTTLVSPGATTFGLAFPPLAVIWAIVALALAVVLHRTTAGRALYATGSNPVAAELALVRTRRVWMAAFVASAMFSALLGVLLAGFASGDQTVGNSYLFESLTAVIVGGTAFGGRGDYSRTVVGALLLTVLTTVLVGHGYSEADQQMLYGVIILAMVAAYGRDRRVRDRI